MMNIPKLISAEYRNWFEDAQSTEWLKDWLIGFGLEGSFILYVKLLKI